MPKLLDCCPCPGQGSGAGSGGNVYDVEVDCCPGVLLPRYLRFTFDTTCACVDGYSYELEFDYAHGSRWVPRGSIGQSVPDWYQANLPTACTADSLAIVFEVILTCTVAGWLATINHYSQALDPPSGCFDAIDTGHAVDSEACDPFEVTVSHTYANDPPAVGTPPCPAAYETCVGSDPLTTTFTAA